ncbi:hypothetical protein Pcinc_007341 [Petrolisthes cinctipes]|uniref:Reverse transcriptase domain-containing protein n=1 Tax=Petrolisthes cinctipes TaxID=88211 RepID=A0AAE1G9K7_PETCI|nr:hypothetical protein Pcinc_007341 [Petrolisthes cinctipes]
MLDVIYLHFAKAFNKVNHGVLHKYRYLGISGRLGFWIYEFLTNRTQFVAVSDDTRISRIINNQDDAVLLQKDPPATRLRTVAQSQTRQRFKTWRLGHLCTVGRVHSHALTRVKTLRINAFATRGPTLFNALPITLRARTDVSLVMFKATLDRFLRTLLDEPPMPHYHSRSSTISIVDWLAIQCADGRFTYHEAATHRNLEAEQHCF